MRRILTAVILTALWLLMSGIYKPLIIGFGLASVMLVVLVIRRMDAVDQDRLEIRLKPLAFLRYCLWLLVEIARANWTVTRVILSREMPLRQHLFATPMTQRTDLGQVIFANSITLTPGTITVETEPDHFLVHALDYSPDDDRALKEMNDRVTAAESGGAR